MLVLGDLGDMFSLVFIGAIALIFPSTIALVASLLTRGASRGQLRTSQVYCFATLWLISLGALIGTFYVGEGHFGVIVAVIYIVAATVSGIWSVITLKISIEGA